MWAHYRRSAHHPLTRTDAGHTQLGGDLEEVRGPRDGHDAAGIETSQSDDDPAFSDPHHIEGPLETEAMDRSGGEQHSDTWGDTGDAAKSLPTRSSHVAVNPGPLPTQPDCQAACSW